MTTTATQVTRIPVTTPEIIRALLPGAKNYHYTVTQDDFDEFDDEAAGEYEGVYVTAEVAELWDRGLAACKAAGVGARTRAGLEIRCEISRGTRELPAYLDKWIGAIEAEEAAFAAREAERKARVEAYRATFDGYTNVGADGYTGEYWGGGWRKLREVARIDKSDLQATHDCFVVVLPDSSLMELCGVSWTHWTRDAELIADRQSRKAIKAYRYEPELWRKLYELEAAGGLRDGIGSWFGGVHGLTVDEPVQIAYGGMANPTAPEKIARLREWLNGRLESRPQHAEALRAALDRVADGCIAEVR